MGLVMRGLLSERDRVGPGEHAAVEDVQLLEAAGTQRGRRESGPRPGVAHEDDVAVGRQRVAGGRVTREGRHGDVDGARDAAGRQLVGVSHVEDEGACAPESWSARSAGETSVAPPGSVSATGVGRTAGGGCVARVRRGAARAGWRRARR